MISVKSSDNLAQTKNSASKSDIGGGPDVLPLSTSLISPIASDRIALPGQAGEGQLMGHNKGRDNARKRSKRRKKTERLALAKQKKSKK